MSNHPESFSILRPRFRLLAALFCFSAITMQAQATYLDHLIRDLQFTDQSHESKFGTFLHHLDNEEYIKAEAGLQELLSLDENAIKEDNPVVYAKTLSNLGITRALQNNEAEALSALDQSVQALELLLGPFTIHLIEPLIIKSLVYNSLKMYAEAEDELRRAQHIIHRHGGVYSPEQVPVVEHITVVKLKKGEMGSADQEQRFNLKIHEQTYGNRSEELITVLQDTGAYFAHRGNNAPLQGQRNREPGQHRAELFRYSISLYERAVEIIEEKYGPDDIRLIAPLRGLAEARILQVTGRRFAEDALERVLEIVERDPGTDLPDYVRALVDLGDVYLITNDRRAEQTYLKAWHLLADKPELSKLQNDLFGTPERLHPLWPGVIVLDRKPFGAEDGDRLYVDAEYTVRANGSVSDVNVIDGNVSNSEKRAVRHYLTQTRFRPRIVDGETKETTGLMLHQPFIVEEKEPVTEISFSVETY